MGKHVCGGSRKALDFSQKQMHFSYALSQQKHNVNDLEHQIDLKEFESAKKKNPCTNLDKLN